MSDITNNVRAGWAFAALHTFMELSNMGAEPLGTAVSDLLCDLMHLCDKEAIDFEARLKVARDHYREEVMEELEDIAAESRKVIGFIPGDVAGMFFPIVEAENEGGTVQRYTDTRTTYTAHSMIQFTLNKAREALADPYCGEDDGKREEPVLALLDSTIKSYI